MFEVSRFCVLFLYLTEMRFATDNRVITIGLFDVPCRSGENDYAIYLLIGTEKYLLLSHDTCIVSILNFSITNKTKEEREPPKGVVFCFLSRHH